MGGDERGLQTTYSIIIRYTLRRARAATAILGFSSLYEGPLQEDLAKSARAVGFCVEREAADIIIPPAILLP